MAPFLTRVVILIGTFEAHTGILKFSLLKFVANHSQYNIFIY